MARLLADENIHPILIEALRAKGHDVAGVAALGLVGATDERILDEANREARILMTADKDFGLILEAGPLSGRGRVLLLRYRVLRWERIARDVAGVLAAVEDDYVREPRLLVVVTDGGYRIRRYPAP
jgi:predicted nuclease of predicted toxin-antitoxin system